MTIQKKKHSRPWSVQPSSTKFFLKPQNLVTAPASLMPRRRSATPKFRKIKVGTKRKILV